MKQELIINEKEYSFDLIERGENFVEFEISGKKYHFELSKKERHAAYLTSKEGTNRIGVYQAQGEPLTVLQSGNEFKVSPKNSRSSKKKKKAGSMISPMPGKILKLMVVNGQVVKKGEPLLILEAMKMEHTIKASSDGVMEEVFFSEGELVQGQVDLVRLVSKEKK